MTKLERLEKKRNKLISKNQRYEQDLWGVFHLTRGLFEFFDGDMGLAAIFLVPVAAMFMMLTLIGDIASLPVILVADIVKGIMNGVMHAREKKIEKLNKKIEQERILSKGFEKVDLPTNEDVVEQESPEAEAPAATAKYTTRKSLDGSAVKKDDSQKDDTYGGDDGVGK